MCVNALDSILKPITKRVILLSKSNLKTPGVKPGVFNSKLKLIVTDNVFQFGAWARVGRFGRVTYRK